MVAGGPSPTGVTLGKRPSMGGRCLAAAPSATKEAEQVQGSSAAGAGAPGTATAALAATMGSPSCCLLLTLVLLSSCAAATRKCNLQGLWRNELGSNMTLSALDAVGTFSGSYHTAVAATDKQILVSPLQGSQQHTSAKGHPTFGFTVQWQFADSTTVFVGQCFVDRRGKETLETTWLLQEEVPSRKDAWKATRVGTSIFTRIK
ncbi:avidin-like [Falco cherrug]|uniref:avidin-like n=1 Tax=Falco cherrug TaxID=345164 RepID=UPI002479672E|nr:avidin-like [Falco cherrug]